MHLFDLILQGNRPPIQVMVVQYSNEQSIQSLFELIYTDPGDRRRRASAILLRPCVAEHFTCADLVAAVRNAPRKEGAFLDAVAAACATASRAFWRFEDIPVFVLHSDNFEHRISANINSGASVPTIVGEHVDDPASIVAIRTRELNWLVERSRALLTSVEGAYYDPPSHRPIRSFLRIGNIQYSRQAVDALAFWLLPHAARARGLLIDTWSISSLAFNLSRVLTLYDGRPPIPVEMLSRYQDRSPEAQVVLLEVLDRLWSECPPHSDDQLPITCIVSATQSGSLVDVLKDEIDQAGLPIDMSFVALFQLGKTDALPSLCDRSDDPEFTPLSSASINARSAIEIDPQVYFPLTYRDMEYVLRQKHAKHIRDFIQRFGTEGIFSAHRDHVSDGALRHHTVHLDMAQLIATPAFQAAFDDYIRSMVPLPSVVLTPRHEVAHALGERAVAVLTAQGKAVIHLQHPTLLLRDAGPGRDEENHIRTVLAELNEARGLLILDDCFITGDRLTGYQTRLRQLNVRAHLHYLVAVARPDDLEEWETARAMLQYRGLGDQGIHAANTASAIHELCLPNWQQADCPWCTEERIYRQMLREGHYLPDYLLQRLDRLMQRDIGLVDDLFLVSPDTPALRLFTGSVFVAEGAPQATIFAAVASAVQHLRTAGPGLQPTLGQRRYPVATVLKAREYLKSVYKDSVLRAAILRACTVEELVYMSEIAERRRKRMITALLTAPQADENDIGMELILAHAAGKCDVDPEADEGIADPATMDLLKIVRVLRG